MKERIGAVHATELEGFFTRVGLLEKLKAGTLVCANCGRVISLDNFYALERRLGVLVLYCNSPGCFAATSNPGTQAPLEK